MKIKVLGLVISLTLILAGVLLWQTDQLSYEQDIKGLEKQLRQQSVLYESRFLDRINQYQAALYMGLRSGAIQKGDWSLLEPFQQVLVLDLFGSRFSQKQVYEKSQLGLSPVALSAFIAQANLEFEKSPQAQFLMIPFKEMNRSYTGLVFVAGAKAYALLAAGSALGAHHQIFQYPIGEVELFTKSQFVVSAPDQAYIGSVRSEDRVSQVALQTAHSRGLVKLENESGPALAFFSRISDSNVILISKESLSALIAQSRFAAILTGLYVLSFAVLLSGFIYYLYRRFVKNLDLVEAKISALIQGKNYDDTSNAIESELKPVWGLLDSLKLNMQKVNFEATPVIAKNPEATDQDKISTFKKVASSLVHEFRAPLASVIGFAQMILNKKPEAEIQNYTQSILREVRHTHDILEKLKIFSGEVSADTKEVELMAPLMRAMNNFDQVFKDRGISVHRKLNSQAKIFMNMASLQLAFENIIKNSIEALERMPEKEITVSLTEDENFYYFEFVDSGEGMDSAQLEKAVDPFFTTRSFQNHVGLGLSLAAGVVREHGGQLSLQSSKGQGTKIMIQLPKVNPIKEASTFEQKEVQMTEASSAAEPPIVRAPKSAPAPSVLDHLPEPDLDLIDEIEVRTEEVAEAEIDFERQPAVDNSVSEGKAEIDLPKNLMKTRSAKDIDSFEVKIRGPKPRSV